MNISLSFHPWRQPRSTQERLLPDLPLHRPELLVLPHFFVCVVGEDVGGVGFGFENAIARPLLLVDVGGGTDSAHRLERAYVKPEKCRTMYKMFL
jgi:hypothetical protein